METLIINIPDKKSNLIKRLLKELGVTIKNIPDARRLAEEINNSIKPGDKPTMEDIIAEVKSVRSKLV